VIALWASGCDGLSLLWRASIPHDPLAISASRQLTSALLLGARLQSGAEPLQDARPRDARLQPGPEPLQDARLHPLLNDRLPQKNYSTRELLI
jgi:hypothetical protein